MPKWFARVFAVVMVLACIVMAWYAYQHERLNYSAEDVRTSLETSQARERKQQYEYDEVVKKLPEARSELDEVKPQADQAAREEAGLRQTRQELRDQNDQLNLQIEQADTRLQTAMATVTDLIHEIREKEYRILDSMNGALGALMNATPSRRGN